MSPKSTLHQLKRTLPLSFLALVILATSAWAGVSPPFASVETPLGLSIVYKSSTDKSLWTVGSTNGSTWPSPTQLPTLIGTNFAPTAVVWNGFTYVIYGSLADNTLWMTDSSNWSQISHLPAAIQTYTTPSAVVYQSKLFLVYKSTEDATLWAASSDDGLTWELNHLPTTITTSASPATAVWNDRLYTFYRSAKDGTIWFSSSSNGKAWDRPSQVSLPASLTTSAPPAVTVWDDELYVVFRSSSDQTMWVSHSPNGFTWDLHQLPPTATTSAAPSVSLLNNQLYVLYKSSTDNTIWQVHSLDGVVWTSPSQLPSIITTTGGARGWNKVVTYGGLWSIPNLPSAAIDDNSNPLFTWADDANNLKLLYPAGGSIPVTLNLGGIQGSPSSIYVNGSFYIFWRASATGQLHYGILNDPNDLPQGLRGIQALGGAFSTDGPQVTLAGGPGQPVSERVIYVAWKGTGGDDRLYSGYLSNLSGSPIWSGTSLFVTNGTFNSVFSPAVGANQAGSMFTVWRGVAVDPNLYFSYNLDFTQSSYRPLTTLNTANGTTLQADNRPSLGVLRSGSSNGSLVVVYTIGGGMYYTIGDYSGTTVNSWANQSQILTPSLPNPKGLLVTNPSQSGSPLYLLIGDRDGSGLMVNALYLYEFLTD